MGKSDRAFLVGALALATFVVPSLYKVWPWVFWLAAALTVVTCVRRCRSALSGPAAGEAA